MSDNSSYRTLSRKRKLEILERGVYKYIAPFGERFGAGRLLAAFFMPQNRYNGICYYLGA